MVVSPVVMTVAVLLPSARDGFRAMRRLAGTVFLAGLASLGRDVVETLLTLGAGTDVINTRHGSVFCHLPVTSFSIFSGAHPGNPTGKEKARQFRMEPTGYVGWLRRRDSNPCIRGYEPRELLLLYSAIWS